MAYSAFISHASEDKESFVEPLMEALSQMECRVWYDKIELEVGDSLRRSIDRGLSNSEYGIVVLSPAFFAKNWPQYELDGLTAKEMAGGKKVILPIWHNVDRDDVLRYSPALADKVALLTKDLSVQEVAEALGEVLFGAAPEDAPEEETEAESIVSDVVARPDIYEEIRRLAELKDEGLITSEEFEAKKRELLDWL